MDSPMRGAMPDQTGVPDALADDGAPRAVRARARGEPVGIDVPT